MSHLNMKSQGGAALVVSLILLLALTVLGIASMNTASLDLIMAGNEQFRTNAFQAAEVGIETALSSDKNNFDTTTAYNSAAITLGDSSYTYDITPQNVGQPPMPPPPGYSTAAGKPGFGSVTFTITVRASSVRGTAARHIQEVNQIVNAGDSTSCITSIGSCSGGGL